MLDSQQDDSKDRPYICPCGKSYLSYPALFTHIKQKHNGTPPGQIIRPKSLNKRGRPRKNPADLPSDTYPHILQFKNPLARFSFNKEEPESLSPEPSDPQYPKDRYKPVSDFIPPIPSAHLSLIKNNRALYKPQPPAPSKSTHLYPQLRNKLKAIFQPLHNIPRLNSHELDALLQANGCYREAKSLQRRGSRRPVGVERWEMELRTALLEFMDQCEDVLSRLQFKNMEVLVGLILIFYYEMLPEGRNSTTATFVAYLNNFAKTLLVEVKSDPFYKHVFALEKEVPLQILSVINEWLVLEGLSHYDVHMNPNFNVPLQEREEASEASSDSQHQFAQT